MASEEGQMADEDLQHYIDVFSKPLTESEVGTLAMLSNVSGSEA